MAEDRRGSSLTAGVVGAVIGAAAAAAAIALSDEKNRKKAEQILLDMQKQGNKIFKEITKKAIQLKDLAGKTSARTKEESKKLKTSKKK